MRIELRYFASLREAIGHAGETVQTHASTVGRCATN